MAAELSGRNDIAIRAALLTRCQQVIEKPWAYPASLDTKTCRKAYLKLQPYVSASDSVANTASDPWSSALIGGVLTKLLGASVAFGYGLVTYYGGKSKDYYEFYARRIASELALRGIPESSL